MRVGIIGCSGRMGKMLVKEVLKTPSCELAGGIEKPQHPTFGQDIARICGLDDIGLNISDDAARLFIDSDVVIDFSLPSATEEYLRLAVEYGVGLVMGTTGHNENQLMAIEVASKNTAIVKAMNFSIGMNIVFSLTKKIASLLDDKYDIEISEMHHKHKVDAPSGSAIALGEAAAKGRGLDLDSSSIRGRDGITGARERGAIGFSSIRGGEVFGDHSVIFAGGYERIELSHKAGSRDIFSTGAVHAARWVFNKKPGLYNMHDVLGLE